jgi:hypothetical protein
MKKLLLLALPFLMLSCSSDDDNTYYPPANNPSGDSYAYMRGNKDGSAFNYTFNLNDASSPIMYGPITSISQLGFDRWFSYGGQFAPSFMADENIYVSFENVYMGSYEDETNQFYDAFDPIPTNYLTYEQNNDQHLKGVSVGYQQEDGVYYYSDYGSQTGSTFTITSSSEGEELGVKIKTIVGTFNCKLYNQDDVADVINITNGTFKVVVTEDH